MNKTLLTYIVLTFAFVFLAVLFVTATDYLQLGLAVALYPILIIIGYKILPNKIKYSVKKSGVNKHTLQGLSQGEKREGEAFSLETIEITDIDKRVFLKLIGGAGLFLFLFSLFNKKTESMFFKNIPGQSRFSLEDTGGKKIDPAQNQPLDGYKITEIDDNVVSFYGFTNKDGAWYIMKIDTNTGSFRYAKGTNGFPANWANRKSLKYDYFSNIF